MANIVNEVMALNNRVFELTNKAYELNRNEHIRMKHNGANTFPEGTSKEIFSIMEDVKNVALEMVDFMNKHDEYTFLVYGTSMNFLGEYGKLSNKDGIVCKYETFSMNEEIFYRNEFIDIDKIGAISIKGRINYQTKDELISSIIKALKSRLNNMPYLKVSNISNKINNEYYYDDLKLEF